MPSRTGPNIGRPSCVPSLTDQEFAGCEADRECRKYSPEVSLGTVGTAGLASVILAQEEGVQSWVALPRSRLRECRKAVLRYMSYEGGLLNCCRCRAQSWVEMASG